MIRTILVVLICTLAPAQTDSAEKQIRATRIRSNQAMASKDFAKIAESLTEDYVQVRGSGVFVPSKSAWLTNMQTSSSDPRAISFERITEKVQVSALAPLAAEHGHWIGRSSKGLKAFGGTYLAMWRKSPTGWKIRSELFVVLDCYDQPACDTYAASAPTLK